MAAEIPALVSLLTSPVTRVNHGRNRTLIV